MSKLKISKNISEYLFVNNLKSDIKNNTLYTKLKFIKNRRIAKKMEEEKVTKECS